MSDEELLIKIPQLVPMKGGRDEFDDCELDIDIASTVLLPWTILLKKMKTMPKEN